MTKGSRGQAFGWSMPPVDRDSYGKAGQIFEWYKSKIESREIPLGQRLPSIRLLSEHLGLSKTTIAEAFDRLLANGYIESFPGSGTFVSRRALAANRTAERPGRPSRSVKAALDASRDLLPDVSWNEPKPFTIQAEFRKFPWQVWNRRTHYRMSGPAPDGDVADVRGLRRLRESIAGFLRGRRQLSVQPEEIFVTYGGTNSLDIVCRCLLSPGATVAVEDPTDPVYRRIFEFNGLTPVGVPVDDGGIDIDLLTSISPAPSAVFLMPTTQFPLGSTLSVDRRDELLAWAGTTGTLLIELDRGGDFAPAADTLLGHARYRNAATEQVVFIRSFSRVLFPGIRLGCLVVPVRFHHRLVDFYRLMHKLPPTMYHHIVADYLESAAATRYAKQMSGLYKERERSLRVALEEHCSWLRPARSASSIVLAAELLDDSITDIALAEMARKAGIVLVPLSLCCASLMRQGFLLGFAAHSSDKIEDAVKALKSVYLARNTT